MNTQDEEGDTEMPIAPAHERMRTEYPEATAALELALAETDRMAREAEWSLHHSTALTRERLIEPILDALGFTERHRRYESRRPARCWLQIRDQDAFLLICLPLEQIRSTDPSTRYLREETRFNGPIIYTNGVEWRTHLERGKNTNHHNGNTGAFEQLLRAGMTNAEQTL